MIDIKNIKSIKVIKSNSNSPIAIPDKIEEIKEEGFRRRDIHPDLKTVYNKY